MTGPDDDDFFVPDEPVEDVRAAFERGKKGVTRRPTAQQSLKVLAAPSVVTFVSPCNTAGLKSGLLRAISSQSGPLASPPAGRLTHA